MQKPHSPVLIAGAGPTGLVLAIWLARFNVPFRIVDRSPRKPETSRAVVVHARTLEFYRQLGISDQVVAKGRPIEGLQILHEGKPQDIVSFKDAGKGQSHFPYALSLPQDWHEEILESVLNSHGAHVERGVEVTAVGPGSADEEAQVTLHHNEGSRDESFRASFVAGCDGSHSAVRHSLGLKMEGGTYDKTFFVADVELDPSGPEQSDRLITIAMSRKDFCLLLPLPSSTAQARLIGLVPEACADADSITFADVQPAVDRNLKIKVQKVNWLSKYKVHHRMASSFRKGRAFVLGDAAHIHSPVGGQGMNTGLGDATNLAWKLASVLKNSAPFELIGTYEAERMPFAKMLLDTTDYAFTLVTNDGYSGSLVRNWIFPVVVPFAANWLNLSPRFFKRVSQTEIEYRQSPLSQNLGSRKGVAAGDRLPYVQSDDNDNHSNLQRLGWQAHIYGSASEETIRHLNRFKLRNDTFPWSTTASDKGLIKDALYLVRPDGYIGLIVPPAQITIESTKIEGYCNNWGIWS